MHRILALIFAGAAIATPALSAETELWRLDCGSIEVRDLSAFSDSFAYAGQKRQLTNSCYLIRHDSDYLIWDTGFSASMIGQPVDPTAVLAPSLTIDLPAQLARLKVDPSRIRFVGASHGHFDHVGQAAGFPDATLLIGAADWEGYKQTPAPFGFDPALVKPWTDGASKVDPVSGDRDVFGDGSVTILATPGHTDGETSLLVRLAQTGPVLLSGDVVHFAEQFVNQGVPPFNADRAESLASMARLQETAKNLGAKLIVQHDETNIGLLPTFPQSAR